MFEWLEQGRRHAMGQVGLAVALLCAAAVVVVSVVSIVQSVRLQRMLDREHALVSLQAVIEQELQTGAAAGLQGAVRNLIQRGGLGLRFVSVRAPGGIVVAQASAFDQLSVPLVSAYYSDQLQRLLYTLGAERGQIAITREGRTLATAEYALAGTFRRQVHDIAVTRLRWHGFVGLLLGLPLLLVLTLAWRRGADVQSVLARRLASGGGNAATVRETAPASLPSRALEAMDQLGHGALVVDRDVRVRWLNATAEALTGWNAGDAAGRLVYSVFHPLGDDDQPLVTPAESALRAAADQPPQECRLRARDGTLRQIEVMSALLRDNDGVPDGAAIYFRDVSGRRALFEDLRKQTRLSQGVIDHLVEGVLTTDRAGVIRFANARALRMFGYAREEVVGATVTKLMPVPFLNSPGSRLTDYVGAGSDSKLPRVVGWRKDATTFPVELVVERMSVDLDEGLVVVVRDVSERQRSENLTLRLGRLLDSAAEEVYIFDAQSLYFQEVNRGARRNLGYRAEQLARMTPLAISPGLDQETFLHYLNRLRGGEVDHLTYRAVHQRADGSVYPVEVRLNYSREEEPPVFMAIASDITERQVAESRLQHLAHHDTLTGLPNRAVLMDRLRQALVSTRRTRRMLGVLFADVDRFKEINDRYGHEIGDRVLQVVAQRIRDAVRPGDTVARISGDEFIVLTPKMETPQEAMNVARDIVEFIRAAPFEVEGGSVAMTVSIGVTVFPADDSDAERLIQHADEAMYEAKRAGRNGCHLYSPETPSDVASGKPA